MNAGSIATSGRLRATLAAIGQGWRSTRDISIATGSMAVHSDIAGLRENGVPVEVRRVPRAGGRPVYEYRVAPAEVDAL